MRPEFFSGGGGSGSGGGSGEVLVYNIRISIYYAIPSGIICGGTLP